MAKGKDFPVDKQFEKQIHKVGHENTKGIAFDLDVPYSTLAELLNPNNQKRFPAASLPLLIEAADDNRLIEYLCTLRDLVAVPLPKRDEGLSREDWLKHLAKGTRETAEALSALADGIADGHLDGQERENCLNEVEDAISALASLREDLKAD